MTVKQRQEFRIVLLKRARRVAERKLEVYDDERVARNVRIRSIIARDLDILSVHVMSHESSTTGRGD